jgi:carboxyl-terminal processing protease
MKQLILDLRGNGGGFLSQAVQVVARFVKGHRKVVFTRGKLSRFDETYYTDDYGMIRARTYPLIVLIDHSSASASEIVAGALQDYDRALIAGETSFGKGLVQNEFELDDGSRLRLTVSKYYTPSGRLIQRPYKGKNIEDYYMESYADSVESSKDSVRVRPQFKTSSGRIVYGGGGITPDVKIKYKSLANNTKLVTKLLQKRIFYETAAEFVNAHPQWKKSFQYFHKNFTVGKRLLDQLKTQAEKAGIIMEPEAFKKDKAYLENRLKAEIARNIWGNFYYYQIGMDVDNQYLKALTLFPKWKEWLRDTNQK